MAAFSHTGGGTGGSGGGKSGGGTGPQTITSTTGPTSSTSNTSQTGGSSSSSSGRQNTTGSKSGTSSKTQTTTSRTQNMDDQSLAALQALIKQLAGGGTEEDKVRMANIRGEIAANQQQRGQYSKDAAFYDSEAAAAAQMTNALKKLLPTITAGIDSAGTSGSAMAALLSTEAAEAASRNAAQLKLDAAISYGQIANQASGVISELLKIDNPANRQLLEALGIAKGAVTNTNQTITEKGQFNENWNESVTSQQNSSSSNWSNTTQNNSQGPQTNTQQSSGTSPGGWQNPAPKPKTGGGWESPSSYNSNNTGGNYFFGAI